MAGQQPLERERSAASDSLPGAFPETPAVTSENQTFSVNPIPASEGAGNPVHLSPGDKVPNPSSINDNSVTSQVHDDPSLKSSARDSEQTFGVAPIPASGGVGNPVHLQPGEKVPDASTITGNTTTSNVKLDQESCERSDAGAPVLPAPLSPQSEREAAGASISGLGRQTSNVIPESSMGMGKDAPAPIDAGSPMSSSVAPQSTTNELAGRQPIEPRGVPQVVAESQRAAHVDPEAFASPQALQEKSELENELHSKVPEAPATTESIGQGKGENNAGNAGMASGGVAAAGAAAAGTAYAMRDKVHQSTGKDPVSMLPQSVQDSINSMNSQGGQYEPNESYDPSIASLPQQTAAGENVRVPSDAEIAPGTGTHVPKEVITSQKEAHVDPEASGNPEAVEEKLAIEKELLRKVPTSESTGEPAPSDSAALTPVAPTEKSSTGAPQLSDPVSGVSPLSMDAQPTTSLNAPASDPAVPSSVERTLAPEAREPMDSRDISPMSKPTNPMDTTTTNQQTQPTVTTGTESSTTPATSTSTPVGTPRRPGVENTTPGKRGSFIDRMKGTPESSKTAESGGKEKKKGFFGRIKEKMMQ